VKLELLVSYRYHTKSEDIMKCEGIVYSNIRLQLLASYLRLADAIHIDTTRVDESLFKIFLETGMPWDSKYHWLKSFWINGVQPDFNNLTITIQLLISPNDAENVNIISDMIEEEVRTELHTVKDILIRGGISYFLDVETKFGLGIDVGQKIDLKQIIGNIQLERKPSASDVMDTIFNTILPILDLSDKRQAYSIIKTYQIEVIKNIVKSRPCHMLASKIHRLIDDNVKEDENDLSSQQIDDKINNLKTKIEEFRKSREESLNDLFLYAKAILGSAESILLFGYSNLVIKALESVENGVKEKSKIYVCECKSKNQYNNMNELVYCDGIEYASQIKKIGYKDVYFVPDILVGNLISRGLVPRVIFGANGVDIESGTFGHTAGHLTIADLAYLYHIPVFVIVDSDKFGAMDHNEELKREINWVTGDKRALSKLEGINLFNPREDIVDADKIYALVTDYGIFPANKIPDTIRQKVKNNKKSITVVEG
jgi:translation initiation factor 2B subunit (eIF-2B alpha/beta/delta family)